MADCRSCKRELPERGFHCPFCGLLVRCRECKDILELDARFCVNCGASTEESRIATGLNNGREKSTDSAHNVVEFEEDTRSRRFRASVSDRAIDSISDPLAFFLANRTGEQFKRRRRPSAGNADNSQHSLPFTKEANIIDAETKADTKNPSESSLPPERRETEQLGEIFRSNADGEFRLMTSRLKQKNQKDFVERLCVLFLYAHAMMGKDMVPRADLNKILSSDVKVDNGNTRTWIAHTDLLSRDNDLIGLTLPGRERAEEVLREVADPNIETKWIVGSKQSGRRGKTGTKGSSNSKQKEVKKPQGKRSRGTSYYALVSKLIAGDFLNQEHSGEEVQAELKRMGYSFPLRRINEALVKHTQNEKLSRREYESGKWTYQKK